MWIIFTFYSLGASNTLCNFDETSKKNYLRIKLLIFIFCSGASTLIHCNEAGQGTIEMETFGPENITIQEGIGDEPGCN